MAYLLELLMDLAFPPVCPSCGRDIEAWAPEGYSASRLCPQCRASLARRLGAERWIDLLDPGLRPEARDFLEREPRSPDPIDVRKKRLLTVQAEALFYYSGPVAQALRSLKFRDRPDWGLALAQLLAEQEVEILGPTFPQWEALIPLPLAPERRRERDYNQSALLLEALARRSGLPVREGCLQKRSGVQRQEEAERGRRFAGQAGAYFCPQKIGLRRLLLFDDVLSSGSSLFHAALALLAAGVEELGFLCLAAGRRSGIKTLNITGFSGLYNDRNNEDQSKFLN